jgi:group I intron endonuclease
MADEANTGIYEIVNLVNGKRYVGSAINFDQRWREHQNGLRRGRHHSRYLQNAWTKYGPASFLFRRIIVCEPSMLLFFEQRSIDAICPSYNISPTAGSTLGVKFTDETKAKIAAKAIGRKRSPEAIERSAAALRGKKLPPERVAHLLSNKHALGSRHSDEWKRANAERNRGVPRPKSVEYRAKISAALKGVPHSPERRAKQAAAQIGLKRKPYSIKPKTPEQRAKMGAAISARQIGKKRPPEVVEKMRIAATGRRASEATRAKMSAASKATWAAKRDEIIEAQARARIEKPRSVDYSVVGPKISAALKGRKPSLETRMKMSAAKLGKKRGPYKSKQAPSLRPLPTTA